MNVGWARLCAHAKTKQRGQAINPPALATILNWRSESEASQFIILYVQGTSLQSI
jgi:hypothetical protein